MKKYRVIQYDHFFKRGHDLKGCFVFDTLEEAEKFIQDREDAKKKWPGAFDKFEYVLLEGE